MSHPTEHQRGYLISLATLLVIAMMVIGLAVGFSLLRNALVKRVAVEMSQDVYVSDANGTILGKAVDFDEHEAPLIPFVDYDVPFGTTTANLRALIGVRDDRFTSRERVYYTSTDCTLGGGDTACVFVPSTEDSSNNQGTDGINGTGGVSYQLGTQQALNYAIGSTNGGLPGRLYRQSTTECDATTVQNISAYWKSQAVVSEGGTDSGAGTHPPCYQEQIFVQVTTAAVRCQPGAAISTTRCTGPGEVGVGEPYCRTTAGGDCATSSDPEWAGATMGACPAPDWFLQPSGNNSGWCCPPGTSGGGAGTCQQVAANLPSAGTFYEAESVGGATNVLDGLTPPFRANLPINPSDFSLTAPDGE